MRLRSFSANSASRKTDALADMVVEVSTIPSGGAFSPEGPAGIGLQGYASAIRGDAGGVGSLSDFVRTLTPGVGGINGISGRARLASRIPALDSVARLTCDAIIPVVSVIRACIVSAPSLRGFFAASS